MILGGGCKIESKVRAHNLDWRQITEIVIEVGRLPKHYMVQDTDHVSSGIRGGVVVAKLIGVT